MATPLPRQFIHVCSSLSRFSGSGAHPLSHETGLSFGHSTSPGPSRGTARNGLAAPPHPPPPDPVLMCPRRCRASTVGPPVNVAPPVQPPPKTNGWSSDPHIELHTVRCLDATAKEPGSPARPQSGPSPRKRAEKKPVLRRSSEGSYLGTGHPKGLGPNNKATARPEGGARGSDPGPAGVVAVVNGRFMGGGNKLANTVMQKGDPETPKSFFEDTLGSALHKQKPGEVSALRWRGGALWGGTRRALVVVSTRMSVQPP